MLQKFGERLNTLAVHSVTQLPESQLGSHYAARIELQATEQITRIEGVKTQLEHWRDEVQQQRKQGISNHV